MCGMIFNIIQLMMIILNKSIQIKKTGRVLTLVNLNPVN